MLQTVDVQVAEEVQQYIDLGRRHGYHYRVVAELGPLAEPLYWHQGGKDFYIIPREEDTCRVPPEVDRAGGFILAAGAEVVQQLIVHDMVGFESYKKPEVEEVREIEVIPVEQQIDEMEEKVKSAGKILGAIAAAVGAALSVGLALASISAVAFIDPALIYVIRLEGGSHVWLETMNWLEE